MFDQAVLVGIIEIARRATPVQVAAICRALEDEATGVPSLPNPELGDLLRRSLAKWQEGTPSGNRRSFSAALRAASAMDRWWLESRALDVVWTGPAAAGGTFRRTEQALLEVIAAARQELWLVSFAGYKLPGVRDGLVAAASRSVRVAMIVEAPEESQGKVTFSTLQGLGGNLAESVDVFVWPLNRRERNAKGQHGSLHVKCAIADQNLLFVTSANLTEFAMSLNMELGLLVRGGEAPQQVARHLRWLAEEGVLKRVKRP